MTLTRRSFQNFLKITSLLFLFIAVFLGSSGAFLLIEYKTKAVFFSSFFVTLPVLLAVVGGFLLLISGSLGCLITHEEPSCKHALFVYFLIIVCSVICTSAALAYTHTTKLDVDLAPLSNVFKSYSGDGHNRETKAVDALQREFQCCGVRNYTDWLFSSWFNHTGKYEVPQSCCNDTFQTCNGTIYLPVYLYNQGCQNQLKVKLQLVLQILMVTCLVVFLLLVMSWISVGQLMKHQPPQEYRILDQE